MSSNTQDARRQRVVNLRLGLFVAVLVAAFVVGMAVSAAADLKLPSSDLGTPVVVERITATPVPPATPKPVPTRSPVPEPTGEVAADASAATPAPGGDSVWYSLADCESGDRRRDGSIIAGTARW